MQHTSSEYDSVTIASSSHRIVEHNYNSCQTIIPKTMKVIRVNTIHPDCIDGCHVIALNYLNGSSLVIDFLILSKSTTSNRWCAIAWKWSDYPLVCSSSMWSLHCASSLTTATLFVLKSMVTTLYTCVCS